MPFFTHGDTKNKLILLYILSEAGTPLTHAQLYRVVDRTDSMTYFDFEAVLPELESEGFVASFTRPFGDCYALSQSGQESASLFSDSIPLSQRERIRETLLALAPLVRKETQTTSRLTGNERDGYKLELLVLQGKETVFGVTLSLASEETALVMRSRWEAESAGLYDVVWDKLFGDAADRNGGEHES